VAARARSDRAIRITDPFRTRARAKVYLKDPLALSRRGTFPVGEAIVGGDTSIAPGPTSSRFLVVDYDASTDRVHPPTPLPRKRVENWARGKGEYLYDFSAAAGTRQEAQINAWATAVATLELLQEPDVLGREIPWAFDGNWLRILPQGMYEANAYYSRQTRALHFGYFEGRDGRTIKTSLSHDIVTHETSHAILDGLRPHYLESVHPDAAAFHEYVGDVVAMLSLFRQRDFLRQLVMIPIAQRSFFDLVTDLAPQVAVGVYGNADRAALRSARNGKTYPDVAQEVDPHARSQVLTGFAFDVLEGLMKKRRAESAKRRAQSASRDRAEGRNDLFRELQAAARHTLRILLRPLDLLPPGEISFPEYAAILLRVDRRASPSDRLGYRQVIEAALEKRELHPARVARELDAASQMPEDRRIRERDIAMIRSSRVGAYRFLDANRKNFRIPLNRDFRVLGVATNRRDLDYGKRAAPETIVQYVWEERVELPRDLRSTALDHVVLRSGGTVVVDEFANLVHWSPQESTQARHDETSAHAVRLLRDRAIELAPVRGLASSRPFVAEADGAGGIRLVVNTARMHHGRNG